MSWTDKRIQTLETMWRAGKSASEIAETLGGVTRNAVIGKANRMGLSNRTAPAKKMKEKTEARPAAPVRPAAKPVVVASSNAPKASGVSLLQLTERMCKWPSGDPREEGFHFCGQPSRPGMPYCQEHITTAYQSGGRNSARNTVVVEAPVVADVPDVVDDEEADAA